LDASGKIAGRLATQIAMILRGKNKAAFRPNVDGGDAVEVINCAKLKFSGKKLEQNEYIWHTNYPGGLRKKKLKEVFQTKPEEVLRRAVWGMLPKNKLRREMIKRLKLK